MFDQFAKREQLVQVFPNNLGAELKSQDLKFSFYQHE